MRTENTALALLAVPCYVPQGHTAPVQPAAAIDPQGRLRDLSRWLDGLADSLESGPAAIVAGAVATLRRGASSYVPTAA